jgi:hypothetical protein
LEAETQTDIVILSKTFPRLLVATEFPPNAGGGGPAVLRQMLKGWPVEKLFWWSCFSGSEPKFGQKTAAHAIATIPPKLYPHRRARLLKSWLLDSFWTPWATNHFERTLKESQPQAIWVIPHQWAIPPLASVLLKSNLNFHVNVQDYMDAKQVRARFGGERGDRWARLAEQLYAKAATRDAISHTMVADLQAKTGCPAMQMLRAGIESEDLNLLASEKEKLRDRIRIAYAGTIVVEKEFALFVSALGKIRNRLPRQVSLEFFGNHSYHNREWFDSTWMNEHGNLSALELSKALRECDWGFSPMGLTDEDPNYNRFSLPTKFITYLAAGLPVVTLGHQESSVVKMALQYDVGLCATASDVETLSGQLLAALSEPCPKSKYRAEILRCTSTEFDAEKMRTVLYDCFRKCASLNR